MFTVIVRYRNQPAHLIYTNELDTVRAYYASSVASGCAILSVWRRRSA